jgi:hypothetical protein
MGLILTPVLSFLKLIPIWVWVVVACLAWGGYQRHRANSVAAEYQQAQAKAATERETALALTVQETARRLAAQQEATNEAEKKSIKAVGDAAAARTAAARLRDKLAALDASGGAASAPAAFASQAGRVADILARCADEYTKVAGVADRSIIAGLACEQSYKALGK